MTTNVSPFLAHHFPICIHFVIGLTNNIAVLIDYCYQSV